MRNWIFTVCLLIILSTTVSAKTLQLLPSEPKEVAVSINLAKEGTWLFIFQSGYVGTGVSENDTLLLQVPLPANETYQEVRVFDRLLNRQFIKVIDVTKHPNCDGMFSISKNSTTGRSIIEACFNPKSDEFSFETIALILNEGGDCFDELRSNGTYVQDLKLHTLINPGAEFKISAYLAPDLSNLPIIKCPANSTRRPLANGYACHFLPQNESRILDANFNLKGTDRHLIERQQDFEFQSLLMAISLKVNTKTALIAAILGAIVGAALTFFVTQLIDWRKRRRRMANVLLALKLRTIFIVENVHGFIKEIKNRRKPYCPYDINSLHPIDFALSFDDVYDINIPELVNLLFKSEDKIKLANDYNRILREAALARRCKGVKKTRGALLDVLNKDLLPKLHKLLEVAKRM